MSVVGEWYALQAMWFGACGITMATSLGLSVYTPTSKSVEIIKKAYDAQAQHQKESKEGAESGNSTHCSLFTHYSKSGIYHTVHSSNMLNPRLLNLISLVSDSCHDSMHNSRSPLPVCSAFEHTSLFAHYC